MTYFRWIEDLKGDCHPVKALRETPNYDKGRVIETHELTADQEPLDLKTLSMIFPKPKKVRTLQ